VPAAGTRCGGARRRAGATCCRLEEAGAGRARACEATSRVIASVMGARASEATRLYSHARSVPDTSTSRPSKPTSAGATSATCALCAPPASCGAHACTLSRGFAHWALQASSASATATPTIITTLTYTAARCSNCAAQPTGTQPGTQHSFRTPASAASQVPRHRPAARGRTGRRRRWTGRCAGARGRWWRPASASRGRRPPAQRSARLIACPCAVHR